jgi:hypothetical protein
MWKLKDIEPSEKKSKKWKAIFIDDKTGNTKVTHFGAKAYLDYTLDPTNKDRAERYRKRHAIDLELDDNPTRPGPLAYWVLWSSPSMKEGIRNYKKIYNL